MNLLHTHSRTLTGPLGRRAVLLQRKKIHFLGIHLPIMLGIKNDSGMLIFATVVGTRATPIDVER